MSQHKWRGVIREIEWLTAERESEEKQAFEMMIES